MKVPITFDPKVNDFDGMTRDEAGSMHRADVAPGAACWVQDHSREIAVLRFACPCGCGLIGSTPVKDGYGSGKWSWNMDQQKPTLTPSILFSTGCPKHWHGYLTDGVFIPC